MGSDHLMHLQRRKRGTREAHRKLSSPRVGEKTRATLNAKLEVFNYLRERKNGTCFVRGNGPIFSGQGGVSADLKKIRGTIERRRSCWVYVV